MVQRIGIFFSIFYLAINVMAEMTPVAEPQVLIFSKSASGEFKTNIISEKIFRYSFGRALDKLHRRALTNIDKFKETTKDFKMSRVIVGLKIESEFSVAKVINLGVESAFDLRYEPLPKPKSKTKLKSKVKSFSNSSNLVLR